MGVDHFTKWIEEEVVEKITDERVHDLYSQKIICMYRLPGAIIFDNGTQLVSAMVTSFCRDLGVQIKFVFVVHPQANGQEELMNKVILKILNKLDDVKGL